MADFIDKDGIENIYNNFRPAFKNLYTIEVSSYNRKAVVTYTPSGRVTTYVGDIDSEVSTILKYHSQSVKFNGETLNLERNSITKRFQVPMQNGYTWTDILTITIRESDKWKIKKDHEEWVKQFYDRESDRWLSTDDPTTRYRRVKITLPNNIQAEFLILPAEVGGFDLGWGANADIVSHTMNYKVENWRWID